LLDNFSVQLHAKKNLSSALDPEYLDCALYGFLDVYLFELQYDFFSGFPSTPILSNELSSINHPPQTSQHTEA
jgi:hypothetical protein